MRLASRLACCTSINKPEPGERGTPVAIAISLALCFKPNIKICSQVGPIKTRPCASTCLTKSAFSLKKPYPG